MWLLSQQFTASVVTILQTLRGLFCRKQSKRRRTHHQLLNRVRKNRKSVFMRYSENAGVSWEGGVYFYLCLQYSAVCLQISLHCFLIKYFQIKSLDLKHFM